MFYVDTTCGICVDFLSGARKITNPRWLYCMSLRLQHKDVQLYNIGSHNFFHLHMYILCTCPKAKFRKCFYLLKQILSEFSESSFNLSCTLGKWVSAKTDADNIVPSLKLDTYQEINFKLRCMFNFFSNT